MSVLVVALLSTACVGQETAGGLSGRTLQDPPPLAPDYRWDEDTHATLFGRAACALDDLDGDGYAEFAVGAPMAWSAAGRTGSVLVFSGRDPEVLFRVDGRGHGAGLGGDLIAVADLDGDGVRELAIG